MSAKRRVAVVTLAAVSLLSVSSAASAIQFRVATSGTAFAGSTPGSQANVITYMNSANDGTMNYWGYLHDTAGDGHSVYSQGKINAYGWGGKNTNSAGNGSKEWQDTYLSDYDSMVVNYGWVQACVEDWGTNTCDTEYFDF